MKGRYSDAARRIMPSEQDFIENHGGRKLNQKEQKEFLKLLRTHRTHAPASGFGLPLHGSLRRCKKPDIWQRISQIFNC